MNNSFLLCKFSPLTTPDVAKKKGKAEGSVLDLSDTESVVTKDISSIVKSLNQKMGVLLESGEEDDQSMFITQKFPDSQQLTTKKGKPGKNSKKSPFNTSFNKNLKAKTKTPEKLQSDSDSSLLTSSESELEEEKSKKSPVKNSHKSPAQKSPKRKILHSSSDSSDEEEIETSGRKTAHELSDSDDQSVVIPVLDKSGNSSNTKRAKITKPVKGKNMNANATEDSGSESLISPRKKLSKNNLINNKKSSRKESVESDSSSDSEDNAPSNSKASNVSLKPVGKKSTSPNKKPVDSSDDLSSSESEDETRKAKTDTVKRGASLGKGSMNKSKTEASKAGARKDKGNEESDSESSMPSSSSEEEEIEDKAKKSKANMKGKGNTIVASTVKKTIDLGKGNAKGTSATSKQTMSGKKQAATAKKSDKNKKDTNSSSSDSEAEGKKPSSKQSNAKSSDISSLSSDISSDLDDGSKSKAKSKKKEAPSIQKVIEDSMITSKEDEDASKKKVTRNRFDSDPLSSMKKSVNWIRNETKKTENMVATANELTKDSFLPASNVNLKYDRYNIPEKFELKSTKGMEKDDQVSGSELYIIRAPAEFDITALNEKSLNLDGTPSIFSTKDDREYEIVVHPNSFGQNTNMYCMSAGKTEGHVALSGAVHSSINIVSWYPCAPPIQLQPPAPTRHRVPGNLKPTFKPFGSMSPPRTLSSPEPVKKQKKSKGSRKRKHEAEIEQEVTEEEKTPKHSKKKKHKKGKV